MINKLAQKTIFFLLNLSAILPANNTTLRNGIISAIPINPNESGSLVISYTIQLNIKFCICTEKIKKKRAVTNCRNGFTFKASKAVIKLLDY